jgi:hypothetical protein
MALFFLAPHHHLAPPPRVCVVSVTLRSCLAVAPADVAVETMVYYLVMSDSPSSTQLFSAIEALDLQRLKSAIAAGSPVDARDEDGRTALMLALARGADDLSEELVLLGADLLTHDSAGRTVDDYRANRGRNSPARAAARASLSKYIHALATTRERDGRSGT